MTEDTKPCPVCGEDVKSTAKKCVHCEEFIAPRTGCRGWLRASWAEITGDKTLWDFVSLLIVPLALAGVGLLFSSFETQRQNDIEGRRATAQAEVEHDRFQETSLQDYFDEMTELLLDRGLRNSQQGDEVWILAQARTVTTLRQLDVPRRNILLSFLRQADLLSIDNSVQVLRGADLSGADLSQTNLNEADLSQANLYGADLSEADLVEADLSGAIPYGASLFEADLRAADLSGADLRRATLSGADLRWAKYNDDTQWPDGFTPPPEATKEE